MNRQGCAFLFAVLLTTTLPSNGAARKPAKAPASGKPARCPTCHIKLAVKKTKLFYVPIKVNGKTYYCCPFCKMPRQKK